MKCLEKYMDPIVDFNQVPIIELYFNYNLFILINLRNFCLKYILVGI